METINKNQPVFKRFIALDVFRGLTIALMILVNNPGSWTAVYPPLLHAYFNNDYAHWFGSTPTDWVFPFFLFIVGVSMRFSFIKFNFTLTPELTRKILGRSLTIIFMGMLLNAFPFIFQDWDLSNFRIPGVLQRIGLVYGITAFLVLNYNCEKLRILTPSILLGYWAILWFWGGSEPFGLQENAVRKLDIWLMGEGHIWHGLGTAFDPEGLLSTLPSIVTVLFGFRIGMWLHQSENMTKTVQKMLFWGTVGIVSGFIWGFIFPLNKSLWTSSYVLHTGGLATVFLAICVWVIDIKGWKKWTLPFVIFGTNSIFVFLGTGIWGRILNGFKYELNGSLISGKSYVFITLFKPFASDMNASLLFAIIQLVFWGLILTWLYKKKIFFKV